MPKCWYDIRALEKPDGNDGAAMERYELNRRIVANKKPYFMRYIYPALASDYSSFISNTGKKALIEFGVQIDELMNVNECEMTDRQKEFVHYYEMLMPVGIHDCTMNRICRRVEQLIRRPSSNAISDKFDCSIMKTDAEYPMRQYYAVVGLVREHNAMVEDLAIRHSTRLLSKESYYDYKASIIERFRRESEYICSNPEQLSNIIIDACYTREGTKQFVWDVVSAQIISNMLAKSGGILYYPMLDPDGEIEYCGDTYSMHKIEVDIDGDSLE